jgi:hypothetical protein
MRATMKASAPKTKLNQKIACHDQMPTSVPPRTGPIARAKPDTAAHAPNALARRFGSG